MSRETLRDKIARLETELAKKDHDYQRLMGKLGGTVRGYKREIKRLKEGDNKVAEVIHTVIEETENGERMIFRVWSTITNSYISPFFKEDYALKRWLRSYKLDAVVQELDRSLSRQIERAKERGTSSKIGKGRSQDDWEKEGQ